MYHADQAEPNGKSAVLKSISLASLSRRQFIGTVAAVLAYKGCGSPAPPSESPFYRGPYGVGRAILGVAPGTTAMPRPDSLGPAENDTFCPDGTKIAVVLPATFRAMVYYPGLHESYNPAAAISLKLTGKKYPVVFFAHARRIPFCPQGLPKGIDPALADPTNDYTLVDRMLDHVASNGCVVVVPDLSGLTFFGFAERAAVLVGMYQHLKSLNPSVFSGVLDLTRIVLAGHSTGGGACLVSRANLVAAGGPNPVAMGLLAPAVTDGVTDTRPLAADQAPNVLMVLKGTADTLQVGVDPDGVYSAAHAPRVLVTVPGANHFGYTDICAPDNKVCAAMDSPGAITTLGQQLTGGAYLSALVRRFALGDMSVEPYLSGQRIIEVDTWGVTGVSIASDGM